MKTKIQDYLRDSDKLLSKSESPRLDLELLLCFVCGISKQDLILNPDKELNKEEAKLLEELIAKRNDHIPVAYLIKSKEFYSYNFYVDERVLVPRPETELLVELSLVFTNQQNKKQKILELGTGSGCIAITLALELLKLKKDFEVTVVDTSKDALVVAKKNASSHKVEDRINFIQSDWFQNVAEDNFDLIVSNPPYVNPDLPELSPELQKEPSQALFSSEQGLKDIKKIISESSNYLSNQGALFCEIGSEQAQELAKYMDSLDKNYQLHKDLAGLNRVLELKST